MGFGSVLMRCSRCSDNMMVVVFQTNLLSVDSLTRVIHPSQLTEEFDGTLSYDNDEWIEMRLVKTAFDCCI